MNSFESLLEVLKNQNPQLDWDNIHLLAENTLDGTFFHHVLLDRDDYFMIMNADGTLNYMECMEIRYLPMFTATVQHEDKIITIFGFSKMEG